ncbi:integrin beta-1-binding protein 1 isoform X2 [Apus apus]|uniref:integrin beta-1-binding protein 1 isoform X2 n=1 Tax=Apus apus TaxID=8895 RepID=UPI0021F89F02|nr:integrin beta-1-binding protein 1 isoform X2 [Apus apus]
MFRKGKKRHSSSSSQSSEISTKSKSVDSSLGGLSRSSTVASLDTDSTKSSGQSNSNSDTCAEFRVKYVGAIEKLKYNESKSLEGPLDLINYIDVAQMESYLLFQVKRSSLWEFPNTALKFQRLISMAPQLPLCSFVLQPCGFLLVALRAPATINTWPYEVMTH